MLPHTVAKAVDPDLFQTANSLKATGIRFSKPNTKREQRMMERKLKNGDLYVMAKLYYRDPRTKKDSIVIRSWPCKDAQDAELIVKYHGHKTGAHNAECVMETYNEEIIRQRITEAKEIAAQENIA